MANRINHLREYDRRRKLASDQQPHLFNEWEDDYLSDSEQHRDLFNLYDLGTHPTRDPAISSAGADSAGADTVGVESARANPTP